VYGEEGLVTEKQGEQAATSTICSLQNSTTDPWMVFLYALKAPATKDKYIQRLSKFLDYLGYQGTKEEKARAFAAQAREEPNFAFSSVLKLILLCIDTLILCNISFAKGSFMLFALSFSYALLSSLFSSLRSEVGEKEN
jgi:hypothetical protein